MTVLPSTFITSLHDPGTTARHYHESQLSHTTSKVNCNGVLDFR